MNHKVVVFLLAIGVLGFNACKTAKNRNTVAISDAVLDSFWNNQYTFEKLELRGKAAVTESGKTNSVSVHIKMNRDSMIWGRFALLGFDLARVYITPERFFLVDYINNTYLDYPTNYLESYMGFTPTMAQLQGLLLGNAPFKRNQYQFLADIMKLRAKQGAAVNELNINESFRTNSSSFTTEDTTQSVHIQYDNYELENNNLMPKNVNIELLSKQNNISCVLNYQYINTSPNLNLNFKIPDGFKRL